MFKQNIAQIVPFITATAYLVWYPVLEHYFCLPVYPVHCCQWDCTSVNLFHSQIHSSCLHLMILGDSQHFQPHFGPLQAKFQVNSVHYLHSILKKVKSKSCFGSNPSPQLFATSTKRDQPIRSKNGQFISH